MSNDTDPKDPKDVNPVNPHKPAEVPPEYPGGPPVTTADEGEGGIPQGSGGGPTEPPPTPPGEGG